MTAQTAEDKTVQIGMVAARGTVYLLISKILSRAAGIVGGIYLVRLLGPDSYGIFNVAIVLPGTLAIFNNLGVLDAATRYSAQLRHSGRHYDVPHYLITGLIFNLTISFALSSVAFLGSDFFSEVFLQKPYVATLTRVAVFLIPAWLLVSYWQSILLGLDRVGAFSIVLFCFEVANAALPIVLLLSGLGVFGAILGMSIATLSFGVFGTALGLFYANREASHARSAETFGSTLRKLLVFGLPLSVGTLITLAGSQLIVFLIARLALPNDIGNYGAAVALSAVMTYITFPISATLFPAFSKLKAEAEGPDLQNLFSYSWKFSSLLLLPTATIVLVLADYWTTVLFGEAYTIAGLYLVFLSASWLWYGLGGSQLQRLISAQGDTSFSAKLQAITTALSIGAGVIGLVSFGILGFLVLSVPVQLPSYFISRWFARKRYGVRMANRQIFRVYLPLLPLVAVLTIIRFIPITPLLRLLTGVSLGLLVYMVSTVLLRTLNRREISLLAEITDGQSLVGPLMKIITKCLLWVANLINSRKS